MIIFTAFFAALMVYCVYVSSKRSNEILSSFEGNNYYYGEFNDALEKASFSLKRWLLVYFCAILVFCFFHYHGNFVNEVIFKIISFLSGVMVYLNHRTIENIRNEINIIKHHLEFNVEKEETYESFSYSSNSGGSITIYINNELSEDEKYPEYLTIDNYYLKNPYVFYFIY